MILRSVKAQDGRRHLAARLSRALTIAPRSNASNWRSVDIVRPGPPIVRRHFPKNNRKSAQKHPDGDNTFTASAKRINPTSTIVEFKQMLEQSHSAHWRVLAFWKSAFWIAGSKFKEDGIRLTFEFFMTTAGGPYPEFSFYDAQDAFQSVVKAAVPKPYRGSDPNNSISKESLALYTTRTRHLKLLCDYMLAESKQNGREPPNDFQVYRKIIAPLLRHSTEDAEVFHRSLLAFPPSRNEIKDMVAEISWHRSSHKAFQRFCASFPSFDDMYDDIVLPLCRSKRVAVAQSWHQFLIKKGHRPADTEALQQLITQLTVSIPSRLVQELQQMHEEAKLAQLEAASREVEGLFPQGRVRRREWKDEHWARIYATRFFSLNAVIRCLDLFGAKRIGPFSTRELLLRCIDGEGMDLEKLQEHLQALKDAGITHDESVFCRLVTNLSYEDNSRVLYDLATCDMHPDEFEDTTLQETLLAQDDEVRDVRLIERTWAVLLLDTTKENRNKRRLNILLRRAVLRDDDNEIQNAMQPLLDSKTGIEWRSLSYMFKKFLPERLAEQVPPRLQTRRLVRIWTQFMNRRGYIPPNSWDDVLRTLLIEGDIDTHEDLCTSIVGWYSSWIQQGNAFTQEQFRALFSTQCVTEILVYNLHHGSLVKNANLDLFRDLTPLERAARLASHPAFRGLRLLLSLRDRGLDIDISLIQQILRKRIWIICSSHGLPLASGVVVRRIPDASERDYYRASEVLIGERDQLRNSLDARHRKRRKLGHLDDKRCGQSTQISPALLSRLEKPRAGSGDQTESSDDHSSISEP